MSQVKVLINSVEKSRTSYLNTLQILSKDNIEFKKNEYSWNITEINEHLYGAEFLGIAVMAKVLAHAISGKLDFHQRSEFLRYHIDRHDV